MMTDGRMVDQIQTAQQTAPGAPKNLLAVETGTLIPEKVGISPLHAILSIAPIPSEQHLISPHRMRRRLLQRFTRLLLRFQLSQMQPQRYILFLSYPLHCHFPFINSLLFSKLTKSSGYSPPPPPNGNGTCDCPTCNPNPFYNLCHITTSCITTPSTLDYCACRAGYRADGLDPVSPSLISHATHSPPPFLSRSFLQTTHPPLFPPFSSPSNRVNVIKQNTLTHTLDRPQAIPPRFPRPNVQSLRRAGCELQYALHDAVPGARELSRGPC